MTKTAARIRMRTFTDDVEISEPLRTERVEIERVPMDRIVATAPETRVEAGVTIIPVVEEVLVVQYRILEEVRITRHNVTHDHDEVVALRREEVDVEPGTEGNRSETTTPK